MEKQNLFTEEELAKVTDEAERKHLIECAQDQSKIDLYCENIAACVYCQNYTWMVNRFWGTFLM